VLASLRIGGRLRGAGLLGAGPPAQPRAWVWLYRLDFPSWSFVVFCFTPQPRWKGITSIWRSEKRPIVFNHPFLVPLQ